MKFRLIVLLISMVVFPSAFADNRHTHANDKNSVSQPMAQAKMAGYCEVELINRSHNLLYVYGEYDDGTGFYFNIPPFDSPHYISLYYYGRCHYDVYLNVQTENGYLVYDDFLPGGSTLRFYDYSKQVKSEVKMK